MGEKTFKIVGNDISDGYHTFTELYEHRCTLFVLLCLQNADNCAWRDDFEGWFVLYWESPSGQISYHIPNHLKILVSDKIPCRPDWIYDGHNSSDVIFRLRNEAINLNSVTEPKAADE